MKDYSTINVSTARPVGVVNTDNGGYNMFGSVLRLTEKTEISEISIYWGAEDNQTIGFHCIWDINTFRLIARSEGVTAGQEAAWLTGDINPIILDAGNYIVGVWGGLHTKRNFPIFETSTPGEFFLKQSPYDMNSFDDPVTSPGVIGAFLLGEPIQQLKAMRMSAPANMEVAPAIVGPSGGKLWIKTPDQGWKRGQLWIRTPDTGWQKATGLHIKVPSDGWRSSI